MILHRDCQPAVIHITSELFHDPVNKRLPAIVWQFVILSCDRCSRHETSNEVRWYGISERPMFEADVGVLQPGTGGELS